MFHLRIILALAVLALGACATRPPGIGERVDWSALQGWEADNHAEAWEGLLRSCDKLAELQWRRVCDLARTAGTPSDDEAKAFFEAHFDLRPVYAQDGQSEGLVTGYYEPLLRGSRAPTDEYRYPLHGVPDDLLVVDLGAVYPQLKNLRLRGKLVGNRVVPYHDRAQLDANPELLSGAEILWVDSAVDAFFLHVQGSGRVRLDDGSTVAVGYANQNGHPYQSIGRVLIDMGALQQEEVSLFTIRDWLRDNPEIAADVLASNPSYVFFTMKEDTDDGPVDSLNVPLTPERSIAVDRRVIPLGAPVWLQTSLPDERATPFNRLMLAQDTGGAIKGHVRADVFWGRGLYAERMAGLMKQPGQLFVLLPKGYQVRQ